MSENQKANENVDSNNDDLAGSKQDFAAMLSAVMRENQKLRLDNKKLKTLLSHEHMVNEHNRTSNHMLTEVYHTKQHEKSNLETLMRLLIHNTEHMLLFFDNMGSLTLASDTFLNAIGVDSMAKVQGSNYVDLFRPFMGDENMANFIETVLNIIVDKQIVHREYDMNFGNGDRHYMIHIIPLLDYDSRMDGVMVRFYDTTKLLKPLNEFEIEVKYAKRASKAKSLFLASMSHEIRTALNSIIGMIEISKSTDDLALKQHCIDKVEQSSKHILGITSGIMNMSDIEESKLEISEYDFQFESMLDQVVSVVYVLCEEKFIELFLDIDPAMPSHILADEHRIAQIITNLLLNAIRFTPEYGKIRLKINIESEEDESLDLHFVVSDTGIGISKEQQTEILNAFENSDDSVSFKYGGIHMGIMIANNIVELMGGKMNLLSEPGHGSSFSFNLNCKKSPTNIADELNNRPKWSSFKIIIADELKERRDILSSILGSHSLSYQATGDEHELLDVLADNSEVPDLIFIDQDFPVDNLLERLKGFDIRPFIFVLVGNDWSKVNTSLESFGISQYVQKPLLTGSVIHSMNACIENDDNLFDGVFTEIDSEDDIFKDKHLLLADDVDINREIVSMLIEHTGIIIDFAADGAEALMKYYDNSDAYDIILMDIHMPNMNGHEAARSIRDSGLKSAETIPIIALTASVFKDDLDLCLESGMNDFLGKPINAADLIAKIKKYLI